MAAVTITAPERVVTTAPGWAETTVRWLRSKHPGVVPHSSKQPFDKLLLKSLITMNYLRFEMVDERKFAEERWKVALGNMALTESSGATVWDKPKHDKLVKFLGAGGYKALSLSKEKLEKAMSEKVVIRGMSPDGVIFDDEIDLEVDALGEAIMADSGLKRPQLSPKHELEEAVADGVLRLDPRFGVW